MCQSVIAVDVRGVAGHFHVIIQANRSLTLFPKRFDGFAPRRGSRRSEPTGI